MPKDIINNKKVQWELPNKFTGPSLDWPWVFKGDDHSVGSMILSNLTSAPHLWFPTIRSPYISKYSEWRYHFFQMSGAFRIVPSPLHGTSQRMRSNNIPLSPSVTSVPTSWACARNWPPFSFNPGKCWPSWLVTRIFGLHILLVWCIRRWHRCTSRSLAITLQITKNALSVGGKSSNSKHIINQKIYNYRVNCQTYVAVLVKSFNNESWLRTHHAVRQKSRFVLIVDHL
jgi:hypothetical protein